jgi:putative hydrolase
MKTYLKLVRFHDLTPENIRRDFQMHTRWTDGEHSAAEVIEAAKKAGLTDIAFTEPIRSDSTYFADFFKEIDALRKDAGLNIWIGAETKVLNPEGDLDITPRDYAKAEIVLGSVHRINTGTGFVHPRELKAEACRIYELGLSLAMVRRGEIDVLAHPAGMSVRFHGGFPKVYLEELIKTIAATDVAFELNTKYRTEEFSHDCLELCRKYNPYVSIGSDVHTLDQVGQSRRILAEALWSTV